MKRKFMLIVFSIIYGYAGLFAQAKTIKDPSGRIMAFECSNGNVKLAEVQPVLVVADSLGSTDTLVNEDIELVNANSNTVLNMQDSVTIVDPNGNLIAVYNPGLKELKDSNNDLVLKLNEINQILDEVDVIQGWITEEGLVYGNDGNLLGNAPGIDSFKLAYFFFYANK